MSRLPIVGFREMESLLLRLGFERTRQRGSHVFYRHADGRTTTLPTPTGRDLARSLLREVLREIELNPEHFRELLRR